jgi:hypothetical protein
VARLETPNITIILTMLQDDCPEGSKRFFGAHVARGAFAGCWAFRGDRVLIEIDDADAGYVPKAAFGFKDS